MKKTITCPPPPEFSKGGYSLLIFISTERNYFSVTGEISTARQRQRGDAEVCGCIHDEILSARPDLTPLIALHLSDLDGIPMHAEANGWYWLAGACGGLGERYHGGSELRGKSKNECIRILSEHLRIPLEEARTMAENPPTRSEFGNYIEAQKPRRKAEAEAGMRLIESL